MAPADIDLVVEMLPTVPDDRAWLALALYREAIGVNSIAYKVLGFAKIINIVFQSGPDQTSYINRALPFIGGHFAIQRLNDLRAQNVDIGEYIYKSCRCAVAHANVQPVANPDLGDDLSRLSNDSDLIRAVAEHCIEYELGVQSEATIRRQHLYQTDGFRARLGEALIACLKNGLSVPTSSFALPRIDLRARGEQQLISFENLQPSFQGVSGTKARYKLRSSGLMQTIDIPIELDIGTSTLFFDPLFALELIKPESAVSAKGCLDILELKRAALRNARFEFLVAGTSERLGRTEPYIPNNIDSRASDAKMLTLQEGLRRQFSI